jgi:hypothetical protein
MYIICLCIACNHVMHELKYNERRKLDDMEGEKREVKESIFTSENLKQLHFAIYIYRS